MVPSRLARPPLQYWLAHSLCNAYKTLAGVTIWAAACAGMHFLFVLRTGWHSRGDGTDCTGLQQSRLIDVFKQVLMSMRRMNEPINWLRKCVGLCSGGHSARELVQGHVSRPLFCDLGSRIISLVGVIARARGWNVIFSCKNDAASNIKIKQLFQYKMDESSHFYFLHFPTKFKGISA